MRWGSGRKLDMELEREEVEERENDYTLSLTSDAMDSQRRRFQNLFSEI